MFDYLLNGLNEKISPTTLRYVLAGIKTLCHIKFNLLLNNVDIIEIGAGYGGQCRILFLLCSIFKINITSYKIFDLEHPLLLQQKYLTTMGDVDMKLLSFFNLDNYSNLCSGSFVISNYCIGEIDIQTRQLYFDRIFKYITHGYMYWNITDPLCVLTLYPRAQIFQEDPLTGVSNVEICF